MLRARWGAAPDPAGEEAPPRAPPTADDARLQLQAVFRSSRRNAGALPQAPPGRMILPGPHPLRMRHDFLIKQCSAVAMRTKTRRSRAGRLCRPACAQAHREKAGDFPKNKLACFLGNPQPFLLPGSSLADTESSRRVLFVLSDVPHRQGGSRDEPQATACGGCFACGEINRNKQSPLWGVAPIEVADQWSLVRGPGG